MIVTPDYYWGWLGGFLCGVGVTAITFLISKTRNNVNDFDDDLEEVSDSENNSEDNCEIDNCEIDSMNDIDECRNGDCLCDDNSTNHSPENVFYFKLSNEAVKNFLAGITDNIVNPTENKSTENKSTEHKSTENNANATQKEAEEVVDIEKLLQEQLGQIPEQNFVRNPVYNPAQKILTPVARAPRPGGYATFGDLEKALNFYKETGRNVPYNEVDIALKQYEEKVNDEVLSRQEERSILGSMSDLIGKNYYEASVIANDRGYFLYPIYVGLIKTKVPDYSKDTIGVRIKDADPNENKTQEGYPKPTEKAIITEIIDVGGNDRYNRGVLNI